jgi:hypothetical protein
MTIKVNIPVSYMVHGYLPERRQPRSYLYAEMMPLEIEEVTSSQAPVAVEWFETRIYGSSMNLATYSHDAIEAFDADGRQHTVFYDGRHWLRVLEANAVLNAETPTKPVHIADAIRGIENGDFAKLLGFSQKTQSQKKFNLVDRDPSDRFDSVSKNLRQRAMAAFDRLALLSVDGILYIACGQPCHILVPGTSMFDQLIDQTMIRHVPFVDVWADRSPRSMNWDRFKYFPLSACELLSETMEALTPDITSGMKAPDVRIPESMSKEVDLGVLADYYVHEFMAKSYAKLHAPFAYTERYFDQPTIDDKAAYLAEHEPGWSRNGAHFKLPVEYLHKAMDILDERSIGFAPIAVRGPGF